MTTCPKCTGTALRHTLVAGTLPAHGCYQCKGISVSLVAYRDWRERSGITADGATKTESVSSVADTKGALLCQKCRNLMTKYRVSADTPNRIDFCNSCEEIWLDGGEWELIENLVGSSELTKIITQPWQHRVMSNTIENMETGRLKEEFGAEYDKVLEFGDLLNEHPAKLEILAYLSSKSR